MMASHKTKQEPNLVNCEDETQEYANNWDWEDGLVGKGAFYLILRT